jgi:hypothetical protein
MAGPAIEIHVHRKNADDEKYRSRFRSEGACADLVQPGRQSRRVAERLAGYLASGSNRLKRTNGSS